MAPDHPKGGTRVNHISFDCYDFDAVEQKIKEAGIKYNKVYVPLGTDSGINQIFVQDPDSHWIEICDCHRFNDFIFGEYDEERGEELRKAYLEGVEPKGTFMATLLFMLVAQGDQQGHSPIRKCSILLQALMVTALPSVRMTCNSSGPSYGPERDERVGQGADSRYA